MAKNKGNGGVYRVTDIIGTSKVSWEDAARSAVETAAKSLRDLRVAEVTKLDMKVEKRQGRRVSSAGVAVIQVRRLMELTRVWLLLCLAQFCASAYARAPAVTPWAPRGISSSQFESHAAFDPRNGDLYFVRSSPEFEGWRIFVSQCTARGWSEGPVARARMASRSAQRWEPVNQ